MGDNWIIGCAVHLLFLLALRDPHNMDLTVLIFIFYVPISCKIFSLLSRFKFMFILKTKLIQDTFYSLDSHYLNVSAIIDQNAEIPCELTPHTKTDNAYLVLWWFDDIFGTPIYRYNYTYNISTTTQT